MIIKQTITEKTEKEVDIELPSYWVNEALNEYIAAISEERVIKIVDRDGYKYVQITDLSIKQYEVVEAYQHWNMISETEFIEIHEQFLQRLSLQPMLVNG